MGVAALAFLLAINLAFRGTLVGTLLGQVVSLQVRAVDYISVGLAIALGAFSVADVVDTSTGEVIIDARFILGWARESRWEQ